VNIENGRLVNDGQTRLQEQKILSRGLFLRRNNLTLYLTSHLFTYWLCEWAFLTVCICFFNDCEHLSIPF